MNCPHCGTIFTETCSHEIGKYIIYYDVSAAGEKTEVWMKMGKLSYTKELKFDKLILLNSEEKIEKLLVLK